MTNRTLRLAIAAAIAGSTGAATQVAWAQGGLEEVIVTATRRAQDLQQVPVSIVAITGENLEMRGLDSLEDVSAATPNLIITGGGGGTGGANFRVRGIPNVGTYIDGVWQVGTAGFLTQEFVDIDRIEVLRGPQGTMFGRDSTGGALRMWTKRPAEEFGANITATVGSNDRRDVKMAVDLPLGDKFLTKWTGANLYRDGYIHSQTTGENNGGIDQSVFRGDILWSPTDRLNVRLNVQDNNSTFTEPRVQDAMFRTFDELGVLVGMPEFYALAGAEDFFEPLNQQAGFPGGRVGKWENRSGTSLPNRYETTQSSIEINWDLTDTMSLQFLTASTEQDSDSVVDWDNSQYDLVLDMNRSKLDVFSQEIQLTGGGDRVDWVAGLYYWDQTTHNRNGRWQVMEFQLGQLDINDVYASAACTAPNPNNFQTCQQVYNGAVGGSYDTRSIQEQDGYAIFGEATIHLTDTLDLTVGLRQHDQSGYSQNKAANAATAPKTFLSR
jgi:iron complex outermembrane receptor protein